MKKIFLVLIIFCALSACKKYIIEPLENGTSVTKVTSFPKKVVEVYSPSGNDTITYEFNDDNTLASYDLPTQAWGFSYTNKKVTGRSVSGPFLAANDQFTYDGDKITNWKHSEQVFSGGYSDETYYYDQSNELIRIAAKTRNPNCTDSVAIQYSSDTGVTTCVMDFYDAPACNDKFPDNTIIYQFKNNRLTVINNGLTTIYEFSDKKIEFQDEVAERFLPVISNSIAEKIIYKKHLANKYCVKKTDISGNVSTFTYSFDSSGRLQKVVSRKDRNYDSITYQLLY